MSSYTPRLKEVLRTHGCRFERPGRGDHEIWYSPIMNRRFPVDQDCLPPHRECDPKASWHSEAVLARIPRAGYCD